MKQFIYICIFSFFPIVLFSQATELTLLSNWQDTTITPTNAFGSRYNEIWGYAQNGREYAIIGSTEGVHFIDVTDPINATEIETAFVQGGDGGANIINRDYKNYGQYLYTVADQGSAGTSFQVIDMSFLPDSTKLVYNSAQLIIKSHNIFIDEVNAKLYSVPTLDSTGISRVKILSLADPENPVEIARYNMIGNTNLPYIHDLYVRNDTAYLNGSNTGLFVVDFSDTDNPELLGTMTDYPHQGYNHSGWLDDLGHYYFMGDETHGMDLKVVDVCDKNDIQTMTTFNAGSTAPSSIAHNMLIRCNRLYVSYYYDGVQVYDISNPVNPERIAYYDTYLGPDDFSFAGAWGVYPFLPSGNIIVSDLHAGLFVLEAIEEDCDPEAYQAEICSVSTSLSELNKNILGLEVFPQPANEALFLEIEVENAMNKTSFELYNLSGKLMSTLGQQMLNSGMNTFSFNNLTEIQSGLYFLQITNESLNITKKVAIVR